MKAYEELTARGQTRRIRPMALSLLKEHNRPYDSLNLIHHGENTTYRVKKGDQNYLCRIHRPGYQTLETINSEMEFIEHYRTFELNVPKPLWTNKKAVFTLQAPNIEDRFGVLFDWRHGKFQTKMTKKNAPQIGAFMARMHLASEQFEPSKSFVRPRLDYRGIYTVMGGDLSSLSNNDRDLIEIVKKQADARLRKIGQNKNTFGMVHGDFHAGNRLFNKGEVVAIDFDDCGWSWFIYDISVCLSYHQTQTDYDALEKLFFEGYRALRPISKFEEESLALLVQVRYVQILHWIAGRTDNPRFVKRLPEYVMHTRDSINAFLDNKST